LARNVFSLDRNWLYGGQAITGCTDPAFDDSGFECVTLPHTNRRFSWHGFDDEEYQFVSVYRRHFKLSEEPKKRRVFVDFEGVMTAATVTLNGEMLGEHRGGYTPFSFEISKCVRSDADNVLAVEVDSTERADIPPFGGKLDYLTFGGIYREVSLRIVPDTFIENVFAKPVNVLGENRRVEVRCSLNGRSAPGAPLTLNAELRSGERVLASKSHEILSEGGDHVLDLVLTDVGPIELWDTDNPKLYEVVARLHEGSRCTDEYVTRIGFREARFTPDGFFLNGRRLKLRGLNRHQT
jgi:beta-galactosidase